MQQRKPLFGASGYQFCSSHIDLGQIQALTDFIDMHWRVKQLLLSQLSKVRAKLLSAIPAAVSKLPAAWTVLGSLSSIAQQAGASHGLQHLAQTPGCSMHFTTPTLHKTAQ